MEKQIWHGILDSDRMCRYAGRMQERYATRQVWVEYLTIVFSGVLAGFLVWVAIFDLEAVSGSVAAIVSAAATVVFVAVPSTLCDQVCHCGNDCYAIHPTV